MATRLSKEDPKELKRYVTKHIKCEKQGTIKHLLEYWKVMNGCNCIYYIYGKNQEFVFRNDVLYK